MYVLISINTTESEILFQARTLRVQIYSNQKEIEYVNLSFQLKEQYPVTAHAPNFDFWTGCREIKRCEESKIILKNPFASRLVGFNTTLKLLRIIDQ